MLRVLGAAVLMLAAGLAAAQAPYPSKPIRIVTSAPGSNNDWGARLVGDAISTSLGQRVLVDNRGGLAVDVVAKSPPDGYTIIFYGPAAWTQQLFSRGGVEPAGMSPRELRDYVAMDIERITKMLAATGFRKERGTE
jgi:tripartite-type tricarboxylate transporter receptor subunit TctC